MHHTLRTATFILAASIATSACGGAMLSAMGMGYSVQPLGDEFNAAHGNIMRYNFLDGTPLTGGRIALNAGRGGTEGTDRTFLQVVYLGTDWMFIENGESLILLIDGDRVAVSGPGSARSREVVTGSSVIETASYTVEPALLRRIAEAKQVRVRIVGSRQDADRSFSAENIARFKAFAEQHIATP